MNTLDNHRFAWLRLARSKNVGPGTFKELLRIFHDPERAIDALPDLAARGGNKKAIVLPSITDIEKEINIINKIGAQLILSCDQIYPEELKKIYDPPPVLIAKGKIALLSKPKIAIVGARNASTNGRAIARNFASYISESGFIITSGLAKGIDAVAHEYSIDHGTIGVVGGGVDYIYPKESANLFAKMYQQGLVLSEHPPMTLPLAQYFPQRNRVISGLCICVLVIEAAKRSGTLTTASFAIEQGREVFAIPGSPLDPRSQGTNMLIRQGATLVETPEEMLEEIESLRRRQSIIFSDSDDHSSASRDDYGIGETILEIKIDEKQLKEARNLIINALSYSPVSIQQIIYDTEIDAETISIVLLELELAGKIERNFRTGTVSLLYNDTSICCIYVQNKEIIL